MNKAMTPLSYIKRVFTQQYSWKAHLQKQAAFYLFLITLPGSVQASDEQPTFVINSIAVVRGPFMPLPNIDDYKASVAGLRYYIEKDFNTKNPSRGKITFNAYTSNKNAYRTSSVLGPFFNKLHTESFAENEELSKGIASKRLKAAILLNRMRSIENSTNQHFYNVIDDLPTAIEHKIIAALWEPQWIKKEITETGQTRNIPVSLQEVADYYANLKQTDPQLAQAFLQLNEYQSLNCIVPYRELREFLLKSEATKSLVTSSRNINPQSPVYIAFMDTDVVSLRTSQKGVFSFYEEAIIKSAHPLHILTTGYSVSVKQNPFISFAVSLDLAQRRALAKFFPLAPYFPEPNAVIRVLDNYETLEATFTQTNLNHHPKYTSPQELPRLIKDIVETRFKGSYMHASSHSSFIGEGDVETEMPIRFSQHRKKKDGTKNSMRFSGNFLQTTNQFAGITLQDLKQIRNISQSHLKSKEWGSYVYKYLEERMHPGSIKIIDHKHPGAQIKSYKNLLLISLFSCVHSAYSPLAITLREVKQNNYSFLEYLFSLIQNYSTRVPATLSITYGQSKSTKPRGDLIKKYVLTYGDLYKLIDKFYNEPIAALVGKASYECGTSEIPLIIHYIQSTHTLPISKPIASVPPQKRAQRIIKLTSNILKKEIPQAQLNLYCP